MTDASSLLTVWKKIVATLRSILLCWSHYHRQENVIPNMMCSSLTPEIHHSNLSTAQLNSCLFIANRSWKVQEWAFSTFQPPSVAWYNYPPPFFFGLPGAIVFVLMVSQPHCNCIHSHSSGFTTYHRLDVEFVLLHLRAVNDIFVPLRRMQEMPKRYYRLKETSTHISVTASFKPVFN